MLVTKRSGAKEEVKLEKIVKRIQAQAKGLKNVDVMSIASKVIAGLYEGVTTQELDALAIKTSASLATNHYEYDLLSAKLSISVLHKETSGSFSEVMEKLFTRKDSFGQLRPAVSDEFIKIVRKHKTVLDSAVVYNRDFDFDYLAIETLKKSYLIRVENKIVERPQHMWLRVALGIHGKDIESAIDTYDKLSKKLFTHATPTLFNAGTAKPQLASCFLLHMHEDSISGIFKTLSDCAKLSQMAGGLGIHHHNIRAAGSPIYGTNGISNGLVPMLKVFDATASYVDQCFTGDTPILTENGWKRIDCIDQEEKVLVSDGSFRLVEEKKEFSYSGNLIEINTGSAKVSVTPEHLILVIRKASELSDEIIKFKLKKGLCSPEWISAKDILKDDVIVCLTPEI